MSEHTGNDHGFTLMEVLVAFTILALTLGALYQLYGGTLARHQIDAQQIEALRVAQSTMAELGVTRPVTADMDLPLQSADGRWIIRVTSEPTQTSAPAFATSGTWVTVIVAASDVGQVGAPLVSLTTYLLVSPP